MALANEAPAATYLTVVAVGSALGVGITRQGSMGGGGGHGSGAGQGAGAGQVPDELESMRFLRQSRT